MKKTISLLFLIASISLQAQININDVVRAGKQISKGTDYTLDKSGFQLQN